jgi:hypothetical protein
MPEYKGRGFCKWAKKPGQLAARIAFGITWGGLMSGRGHRKDQFRVLGSHSALHANIPRKGGPPRGAGSPRTRFFSIELF